MKNVKQLGKNWPTVGTRWSILADNCLFLRYTRSTKKLSLERCVYFVESWFRKMLQNEYWLAKYRPRYSREVALQSLLQGPCTLGLQWVDSLLTAQCRSRFYTALLDCFRAFETPTKRREVPFRFESQLFRMKQPGHWISRRIWALQSLSCNIVLNS